MRETLLLSVTVLLVVSLSAFADAPANVLVNDVTAHHQVRPQVAASGANVYVVWQDSSNYKPEIRLARSSDGGQNFGASVLVGQATPYEQLRPDVAAVGDTVFVVWTDRRSGDDYDVFCAKSTDGGQTFGQEVRVTQSAAGTQLDPHIDLDPSGNPVVVWADNRDTTIEDYGIKWNVYAAVSADDGATFQPEVRVDDTGCNYALWPDVAVATDGTIHVSWYENGAILHARSTDGGTVFSSSQVISGSGGGRIQPRIAVDGADPVYAVWSDSRDQSLGHDDSLVFQNYHPLDVYGDVSSDGGLTWGADIRYNPTLLLYQLRPDIAVEAGLVVVPYSDCREVGNFRIWAWYSAIGDEVRLDDHDGRADKTWPAVAISEGRAYVVWQDNRSGDFDIYLAVLEED